jgi:hypothetical protein
MARRLSPDDVPPGSAVRKGRFCSKAAPDEAALDEACVSAELRRCVEGARTPSEEALARSQPDWDERLGRICRRYTR